MPKSKQLGQIHITQHVIQKTPTQRVVSSNPLSSSASFWVPSSSRPFCVPSPMCACGEGGGNAYLHLFLEPQRKTCTPPTSLSSQGLSRSTFSPFLPSFYLPFFAVLPVSSEVKHPHITATPTHHCHTHKSLMHPHITATPTHHMHPHITPTPTHH